MSSAFTGFAVELVQHVDDELLLDARLEQPVLRRAVDLETGLLQRQRRGLGVLLGDHEIDVVYGFRTAVCPQCVTAGQRELRARAP